MFCIKKPCGSCSHKTSNFSLSGNVFGLVPKSHIRMTLSANPSDGNIALHYGDMLESESLVADENFPTLPNTVSS